MSCIRHWVLSTMVAMATKPNTQPVTTPALTIELLKKVLNPNLRLESAPGDHRDHGYADAMIDFVISEFEIDEGHLPEVIPTEQFLRLANVFRFGRLNPDWATMELSDDSICDLEELMSQLQEILFFKGLDQEDEYRHIPPWGETVV